MTNPIEIRRQREQKVLDFIAEVNPYEHKPGLQYDLRAYSKYLTEHGLTGEDVPSGTKARFRLQEIDSAN